MAEGLLNHLYGDRFAAFSAGTEKTSVHTLAIKAMKRIGIDISHHQSKTVESYGNREFDFVITVCDRARETCLYIPMKNQRLHWSFDDPATAAGTEEEKQAVFERIREEIKEKIVNYFNNKASK